MTPERWQQVTELFQKAVEIRPADRATFLNRACDTDESLRSEVESLLAVDARQSLLDEAALEAAASLLADEQPRLMPGQQIGHYVISELIGRGGMGEVYGAKDMRLNRRIALKLLPEEYTKHKDHLRRFQQEARTASALNHPNILTIHELGEVDGHQFIATEFVEGETLRERMKHVHLSLPEALDIATQVTSALAAAHKAGIVHRDIKPENIMLRRDGYVKVLDFGLAKLAQQEEKPTASVANDGVDISSALFMGTVKYMSPEQARGQQVDSRSDIFSLGVVIYEMVSGDLPFEGKTSSDFISAITTEEPRPLKQRATEPAGELQNLVSKMLQKDKGARYQTAEEVLRDLKRLHEQISSNGFARVIAQAKENKAIAGVAVALLAMVIAGLSFAVFRVFRARHLPFQQTIVTKLTNFNDAWWPSISPDGRYVAYVKGPSTTGIGKNSLWLKTVGTTNEVALVTLDRSINFTRFLPDGGRIGYQNQDGAFVVAVSGGVPTKFPQKGISSSLDGKRGAYLATRLGGQTALVVGNSDGTDFRDITTRQAPNYYWTAIRPSWSADDRLIACIGQNGNESFPHVFVINIETKTETPITSQKWSMMRGIAWLPDMSGLLVVAAEETSSILQIWEISYPGGEARRITNDTVNYFGISIAADGKSLVTTRVEAPTSIWVMPVNNKRGVSIDTAHAKQINVTNFTGTSDYETSARIAWTPDGKIVYVSEESGNADIWSMNSDGTVRKQLTTDPHWDTAPAVSPDGRYIVFMSNRAGAENIWRMDIDGGNPKRLTNKFIERAPIISADSKTVYFVSWETGKTTIWSIPIEGGTATQVITDISHTPRISPDGTMLLYNSPPDKQVMVRAADGQIIKTFSKALGVYDWTPDGRTLTFKFDRDNVINLWEQPLDGSEPRQLTNFTGEGISMYAFSPDGKQLAVARTKFTSDVVLISDVN